MLCCVHLVIMFTISPTINDPRGPGSQTASPQEHGQTSGPLLYFVLLTERWLGLWDCLRHHQVRSGEGRLSRVDWSSQEWELPQFPRYSLRPATSGPAEVPASCSCDGLAGGARCQRTARLSVSPAGVFRPGEVRPNIWRRGLSDSQYLLGNSPSPIRELGSQACLLLDPWRSFCHWGWFYVRTTT